MYINKILDSIEVENGSLVLSLANVLTSPLSALYKGRVFTVVIDQENIQITDIKSRTQNLALRFFALLAVVVFFPIVLVGVVIKQLASETTTHSKIWQAVFDKAEKMPSLPNKIDKDLDIRGIEWLEGLHLWSYFQFLSSIYKNYYLCRRSSFYFNTDYNDMIVEISQDLNNHPEKDIFAYNLLISNNHWTLLLIDRKKGTIEYYDSKKNHGNFSEITKKLKSLEKVLPKTQLGETYQFHSQIKKKLQLDSYQCGPWVLYFLEERLKNPDVDFNKLHVKQAQAMIARHRIKVQEQLLQLRSNRLI